MSQSSLPSQPSQFNDPFALTEAEKKYILSNSVERMINTTLRILESEPLQRPKTDDYLGELVSTNHEDWTDLKATVVKLWDRERDRIFREAQEAQEAQRLNSTPVRE
ncbi:MAG: hypothetical protein AB7L09_21520 [Nitrospira sp.]